MEYKITMENIKTRDKAIEYALNWQIKQARESVSYSELAEKQTELTTLAEKFDLVEEFKENGLI
jgi:hypothetical protein